MKITTQINLRLPPEEKLAIEQRAADAGMSLTRYMISCSLADQDTEPVQSEQPDRSLATLVDSLRGR